MKKEKIEKWEEKIIERIWLCKYSEISVNDLVRDIKNLLKNQQKNKGSLKQN
jgi:hypothetical protein